MRALIDAGELGYNPHVTDPLIRTWLDWNGSRHGWRPPQEECFKMTDTLHGLDLALLHHPNLVTPLSIPEPAPDGGPKHNKLRSHNRRVHQGPRLA
jgi:bifunctional pyridoxal-dependent enzyme with beta-cystathionase and maltose regulon repressor activities